MSLTIFVGAIAVRPRTGLYSTIVATAMFANFLNLLLMCWISAFKIRVNWEDEKEYRIFFQHWAWRQHMIWSVKGGLTVSLVGSFGADFIPDEFWFRFTDAVVMALAFGIAAPLLSWGNKNVCSFHEPRQARLPGEFEFQILQTAVGDSYLVLNRDQAYQVYKIGVFTPEECSVRVERQNGEFSVVVKHVPTDHCAVWSTF